MRNQITQKGNHQPDNVTFSMDQQKKKFLVTRSIINHFDAMSMQVKTMKKIKNIEY